MKKEDLERIKKLVQDKEKDLNRIKKLIQSRDDFDIKIGIGLALEKGISIEELVKISVENEWLKEIIPLEIPEKFKDLAKDLLIKGMIEIFTNIFNYNENENNN
jgi:hypothetical protein